MKVLQMRLAILEYGRNMDGRASLEAIIEKHIAYASHTFSSIDNNLPYHKEDGHQCECPVR